MANGLSHKFKKKERKIKGKKKIPRFSPPPPGWITSSCLRNVNFPKTSMSGFHIRLEQYAENPGYITYKLSLASSSSRILSDQITTNHRGEEVKTLE